MGRVSFLAFYFFAVTLASIASSSIPLFRGPDINSGVIGEVPSDAPFRVLKVERDHFIHPPALIGRNALRYFRDCELIQYGSAVGWIIDGVTVTADPGGGDVRSIRTDFKFNPEMAPWAMVSLALTLLVGGVCWRRAKGKTGKIVLTDVGAPLSLLFLVAARATLFFATLMAAGKFVPVTDEMGYFNVGTAIFRDHNFSRCAFTLGNGFIHGAFSAVLGGKDLMDIVWPLYFFNALIFGSALVWCFYAFARLLTGSKRIGLYTAALYVIYPYFVQTVFTCGNIASDIVASQSVNEYSIRLRFWTDMVGYNGQSDTPNLLALTLTLIYGLSRYASHHWTPRTLTALWLGLFLGAGFLIRMSNLMFAPLVIFLIARYYLARGDYRRLVFAGALFGVGAVIGFAPQLAANYASSGNVFMTPYHLYHHESVSRGFTLSYLYYGGRFAFGQISILLSFALCGALVVPRRALPIIVFFVIPLLVFYSGYSSIVAGIRFLFPLYPMLFALAALALTRFPLASIIALATIWGFKPKERYLPPAPDVAYIVKLAIVMLPAAGLWVTARWKSSTTLAKIGGPLALTLLAQILIVGSNPSQTRYLWVAYLCLFASPAFYRSITCFRRHPQT